MTTFFFVASPSAPFPYGGGTLTSARGVLRMDSGEEVPVYGPYEVVRLLGSGGMGVVYLATTSGGRRVAVKVIRESYASDPVFRLRFAREVAAARTVSGAFTAPVVDADITGPVLWMATSYVQGPTLSEHVEADGPLEPDAVLELAAGLAEALRDIHRVGLVHRDLKPSNILLSDDGPRVIDFGVSRAADAEPLTQTGTLLGTPPYMAPEQLVAPKKTGTEADVFALGSVLVYAATGHGPFDADNAYGIAYNIVTSRPASTTCRPRSVRSSSYVWPKNLKTAPPPTTSSRCCPHVPPCPRRSPQQCRQPPSPESPAHGQSSLPPAP